MFNSTETNEQQQSLREIRSQSVGGISSSELLLSNNFCTVTGTVIFKIFFPIKSLSSLSNKRNVKII
jgi:hypothetical protein